MWSDWAGGSKASLVVPSFPMAVSLHWYLRHSNHVLPHYLLPQPISQFPEYSATATSKCLLKYKVLKRECKLSFDVFK